VFNDEFNEQKLDTSKWWTRFIYESGTLDHLNDEQERFQEHDNHVMTGHSLMLMARKGGNPQNNTEYESGMVRSKKTFMYGYFETRAKVPGGVGVWPGFWLNSASRKSDGKIAWPPEIDILEVVNNGVEDNTTMLHMAAKSNGPQDLKFLYVDPNFNGKWSYWQAPYNFSEGFHVFGGLWDTDNTVSVFVDGRLLYKVGYKWVYDDGTPAGYAHVIFSLAIGGPQWAGRHGIDNSAFPQGFEADYVRVYQKRGQQMTGQDAIGRDLCPASGKC
jgi:beta-glucanase (GH16 family)